MDDATWIPLALLAADLLLVVTFAVRVISARHPVGATLAWLAVLMAIPFAGAALYLSLGERRLGGHRQQRARAVMALYRGWLRDLQGREAAQRVDLPDPLRGLGRQLLAATGMPPLAGNEIHLSTDAGNVIRGMAADVDAARHSVNLLFFIWHDGGTVDDFSAALLRAARRGVRCRVLVDAVGSRAFLRGRTCTQLRQAGVEVLDALPVGPLRGLFRRLDLRNHRKLALIDGEIAWTGSQNLADPALFKIHAGVGRWIDATVRLRGPVVEALAGVFLSDWQLEAHVGRTSSGGRGLEIHPVPPAGDRVVQVLPSGPAYTPEALHRVLLTAMYAARDELVLTTPYFVPDEAMLAALCAAAQRGVAVSVVVPERVDSRLVRHASRSHYEDLLEAGVRILLFPDGLLHAKTITVDSTLTLLGSPNLDMRSFWLNFELTLVIYGARFATELRNLQFVYAERSTPVSLEEWRNRSFGQRLLQNTAQLASPLL